MMLRNRITTIIVLATSCQLLSASVLAQDVRKMTVAEVVEFGLENNHDLRSVRFAVDEARAAWKEAGGAMLPAIRGEGNYYHLSPNIPDFDLSLPPEFGGGDFSVPAIRDRYDFTVRVEQPLFTGLRLMNQRKAAHLNYDARAHDTQAVEADIAFAIRSAYWALFQSQEALGVAGASVRAIETHLASTIRRREEGAALASDVLTMQTRLGEARLNELGAQNAVRIARLRMSEVAGLPLDEEIETTEPIPIDWTPINDDAIEHLALEYNPSIQARRADYDASLAYSRAAQAGWLPQVFFVGLYQYARPNAYIFPQEDVFTGTWQVGVSARWDLWNWGQTSSQKNQAKARAGQLAEKLAATERATKFAVREAIMNVEHRRLAVTVAEQSAQTADAAFAAVERRFELGAALISEVLDAEVAQRNAHLGLSAAFAEYGIAKAALLQRLGVVFPTELEEME